MTESNAYTYIIQLSDMGATVNGRKVDACVFAFDTENDYYQHRRGDPKLISYLLTLLNVSHCSEINDNLERIEEEEP